MGGGSRGCSPALQSLKEGQSRTGPGVGVRSSHAVSRPGIIPAGSSHSSPPHKEVNHSHATGSVGIITLLLHIHTNTLLRTVKWTWLDENC